MRYLCPSRSHLLSLVCPLPDMFILFSTAHVLPTRPFRAGKTRDFHSVVRACSPFLEFFTITTFPSPDRPRVFHQSVPRNRRRLPESTRSQEITWASEMKTRCALTHLPSSLFASHNAASVSRHLATCSCRIIDDMDARMGFVMFEMRGSMLSKDTAPSWLQTMSLRKLRWHTRTRRFRRQYNSSS
jgi:hypothetical protein